MRLVENLENMSREQNAKTQDNIQLSQDLCKMRTEMEEKKSMLNHYKLRIQEKDQEIESMIKRLDETNRTYVENERNLLIEAKTK